MVQKENNKHKSVAHNHHDNAFLAETLPFNQNAISYTSASEYVNAMTDDSLNIRWAKSQIAEQDRIIAEAEAVKAAALAKKADFQGYIRVELAKESQWIKHPIMGALNAAAESFDASARGAKKRAILTVLSQANGSMTTQMILSAIANMGVVGTVENTSPQISTYKSDGFVELAADGWRITQKGRDYLDQ